MKCEKIKENIRSVFDGETPEKERAIIEEHVKVCRNCSVFYDETREMLETLRALSQEKAPDGFTGRLKNRIIAEQKRKKSLIFWPVFSFSAGAVAAAAVFLFLIISYQPLKYIPGDDTMFAGYQNVSFFSGEKPGYVKMTFKSPAEIKRVSIEINLPEGLPLINGKTKAVWNGGLKEGENTILMRVKNREKGEWEIRGVLKKNGSQQDFRKQINVI